MSFWEVHCAWRCFRHWRQWAALAAEETSASRRHWLLLCSFRWWMSMAKHYRKYVESTGALPAARMHSYAMQGYATAAEALH
jgi:hypothetical protein